MPAGPPQKPWTELGKKRKSETIKEIADRILPNIAAPDDYYDFLLNLNAHIGKEHPSIQEQDTKCWQLIKYLSELRGAEQDSNEPTISVQELDSTVTRLGFSNKELAEKGYKLSKSQFFLKGVRSGRHGIKRGRPSKLHNSEFINIVSAGISPFVIDSEQVAVLGRGSKKRMVLVKHLTKTKHRIFQEDSGLQTAMSWAIFHRIMATHFPHIKNPRRKTDICNLTINLFVFKFCSVFLFSLCVARTFEGLLIKHSR